MVSLLYLKKKDLLEIDFSVIVEIELFENPLNPFLAEIAPNDQLQVVCWV